MKKKYLLKLVAIGVDKEEVRSEVGEVRVFPDEVEEVLRTIVGITIQTMRDMELV